MRQNKIEIRSPEMKVQNEIGKNERQRDTIFCNHRSADPPDNEKVNGANDEQCKK